MQPNQDLANLLPGTRFQPEQAQRPRLPSFTPPTISPPPAPTMEDDLVAQQRENRRERRRMKQASPGEGRNARQGGTGEMDAGMLSPTRSQAQGQGAPTPTRGDSETDMNRFGLAAEAGDAISPISRPQRRRMESSDQQSPEPRDRTPSEYGSDMGSPSRRASRTDMMSSRDSLESYTAGNARSGRKGSGFRKGSKAGKQSSAGSLDAVKASTADVHVVGELVGASRFTQPMLYCRWQLLYEPSKSWKVVHGTQQGATHACCSAVGEEEMVVWEHPLDIHMQTQSLQGWPALLLQVFARDEGNSRNVFVSYGLVNLPNTPGLHHVTTQTWFAVDSSRALSRTFFGWFTGLTPRLEDETFITDLRKREDGGPLICTVAAGEVHLRLNILTRNLDKVSHQGGESLAAALERLNTNIRRSAAMEERRRSHDSMSEGLKQIRGERSDRFADAKAALESRSRRGGLSPAPSDMSRAPSYVGRSPKLGSSEAGGPDDLRSQTSYTGHHQPRTQKERMEVLRQRESARKAALEAKKAEEAAKKAEEAAGPEGGGNAATASGEGTGAPVSRAASQSGVGGARRQGEEDDGLETIDGGQAGPRPPAGPVAEADGTVARAAERLARRARMQQRSAF